MARFVAIGREADGEAMLCVHPRKQVNEVIPWLLCCCSAYVSAAWSRNNANCGCCCVCMSRLAALYAIRTDFEGRASYDKRPMYFRASWIQSLLSMRARANLDPDSEEHATTRSGPRRSLLASRQQTAAMLEKPPRRRDFALSPHHASFARCRCRQTPRWQLCRRPLASVALE